jgi:hypothetical protein
MTKLALHLTGIHVTYARVYGYCKIYKGKRFSLQHKATDLVKQEPQQQPNHSPVPQEK